MSVYLGRCALDQLRKSVSERDLAILRSVSRHRFLTARQIEALHFDDHATPTASARVCRRVLARLTHERILQRLERRIGGVRAGSASYVYAVGRVGARLLGHASRVTEPSLLFLDHTVAIGDIHVRLKRTERAGLLRISKLEIEPECWRRFVGSGGARDIVRPDLYLVTEAGDYEDAWFLEVDRGTESPAAISRKCHAYDRYWRSGLEQQRRGAFPLVVWICPNEQRASRVQRVIDGARNVKRELFRVTTNDEFTTLVARGAL
jgi:hypothetical protein